jgi:hypothetical protein
MEETLHGVLLLQRKDGGDWKMPDIQHNRLNV